MLTKKSVLSVIVFFASSIVTVNSNAYVFKSADGNTYEIVPLTCYESSVGSQCVQPFTLKNGNSFSCNEYNINCNCTMYNDGCLAFSITNQNTQVSCIQAIRADDTVDIKNIQPGNCNIQGLNPAGCKFVSCAWHGRPG